MTVRINILGPLELVVDGSTIAVGSAKQRALLCLLACEPGATSSVDRIVDALWGDPPPASAVNAIQVAVSTLRRKLGPHRDALATKPPGYALLLPHGTDATEASALAQQAQELVAAGDHAAALEVLDRAVALWRGEPLADVQYEQWAFPHVRELTELREHLVELRFEAGLGSGRHGALLPELEAAVAREPLREHLRYLLVLALYRSGRQADALAAYQDARRTLDEELGIDPGPELRELERRILQQDPDLDAPPAPAAAAAAPAGAASAGASRERLVVVPAPPAPLVGRVAELQALDDLLAGGQRIITVTGPGGVGKSHLALELARRIAGQEASGYDDVCFVALDDVEEVDVAVARVAAALGLRDAGEDAVAALTARLSQSRALLLLDGIDRLSEPLATLAGDLLQQAHGLQLVTTSRESLRVHGEQQLSLAPLGLPDAAIDQSADEAVAAATGSEAVQLFLQRGRAARPDLQLDAQTAPAIVGLCRWLEGVPLAIELAAAQMRARTPEQLLGALQAQELPLTSRARNLPERQRSLEATVAWSIEQLDDELRTALLACGCFAGAFDATAFATVAHALGLSPDDPWDVLEELAGRSLLVDTVDPADHATTRWSMLRNVRDRAADELAAHPAAGKARDAHARHYVQRAVAIATLIERDEARGLAAFRAELDDMHAVLAYLAAGERRDDLASIVEHLGRAWHIDGSVDDGLQWAQLALAGVDALDPRRGAAVCEVAGLLAGARMRWDDAQDHYARSHQLARASGDERALAAACLGNGEVEYWRGNAERATGWFDQALAHARAAGDVHCEAVSLNLLGQVHANLGDAHRAADLMSQSLDLYEQIGSAHGREVVRMNLAGQLRDIGEADRARDVTQSVLETARERGDDVGLVSAHINLADFDIEEGNMQGALAHALAALRGASRLGDPYLLMAAVANAAWAHLACGEPAEAAAALLRGAGVLRETSDAALVGQAAFVLARYAAATDQHADAVELYDIADRLLPIAMPPWALAQRDADRAAAGDVAVQEPAEEPAALVSRVRARARVLLPDSPGVPAGRI